MFFEAGDRPEEPLVFSSKEVVAKKEKGSDGEDDEQFDGLSQKSSQPHPEKIYVVQRTTKKEVVEEEKKDEEEKKEEAEKPKGPSTTPRGGAIKKDTMAAAVAEEPKMETRKYFNTYKVEFGGKIDLDDEDALIFQTYIVAAEKKEKHGKGQGKDKKEKDKKDKKEKIEEIAADPATALVMGALGGQMYNVGLNAPPAPKKKEE